MIRLVSWNVNGIRANIKKGFWNVVSELQPDILGLQETKADKEIMLSGVAHHDEYNLKFLSCSIKKGYSGVATLSYATADKTPEEDALFNAESESKNDIIRNKVELVQTQLGLQLPEFDAEGRIVATTYRILDPKTDITTFTVINGYYPQGGREGRIPFKLRFYKAVYDYACKLRNAGHYVILCGDLNTTVADIDLARPKENRKTTGCLPEEREALNWFLEDGFVDSFRYLYPDKPDMYSYWDQITRARERNVGWRIDYFLVQKELLPYLKEAYLWTEKMGSDHCPVGIDLDL